jgi:hypothetical protein
VRGHHDRGTRGKRHLDAWDRRPDARVLGDAAGLVLGHVQIGADENAPAGHAALLHQIRKAQDVQRDSP